MVPYVAAVTADGSGNTYVTGPVYGTGFASTPGVVQAANAGGECAVNAAPGEATTPCADAFIAKFDSKGTLLFLTYLGGGVDLQNPIASGNDIPNSLAVDSAGNIYVSGHQASNDFPLAGSPWHPPLFAGGFIAKLSGDGTKLLWSTLANAVQIALGPDASVYVILANQSNTARTLTKLTTDGQFVATLDIPANTQAVTVSTNGSVFLGGYTLGDDVTATPGAWQSTIGGRTDGFVEKVKSDLSGPAWITFAGGSGDDYVYKLQAAPDGTVWASGTETSTNFPVLPGLCKPNLHPQTM